MATMKMSSSWCSCYKMCLVTLRSIQPPERTPDDELYFCFVFFSLLSHIAHKVAIFRRKSTFDCNENSQNRHGSIEFELCTPVWTFYRVPTMKTIEANENNNKKTSTEECWNYEINHRKQFISAYLWIYYIESVQWWCAYCTLHQNNENEFSIGK